MKGLAKFFALLLLLWIAHHTEVYLHEWTHGTVAWITGYKSSPFAIHYGTEWFTFWDINQDVPYERIFSDGKFGIVAAIAMAPMLLQAILFLVGLKFLRTSSLNWWLFAFIYWFTLLEICEVFSYIPIRTFSPHGDMYDFIYALGISPWWVAIPGTLFALWGISHMLTFEAPRACYILKIKSKTGQWMFLGTNILLFFGYYGAVGFMEPYQMDRQLSLISWILVPFAFLFYSFYRSKKP